MQCVHAYTHFVHAYTSFVHAYTHTVTLQAPRFLIKGADLMLPGCIQGETSYHAQGMDLHQVWAVRCQGNMHPFAVGTVQMDNETLETATKGKLLEVVHCLGDLVMDTVPSDSVTYPEGFTQTTCVPAAAAAEPTTENQGDEGEDVDEEEGDKETKEATAETAEETATAVRFPPKAVDALIEVVMYDVLKKSMNNAMLPVDVSAIWGRISQCLPKTCQQCEDEIGKFMLKRGIVVGETNQENDDNSERKCVYMHTQCECVHQDTLMQLNLRMRTVA